VVPGCNDGYGVLTATGLEQMNRCSFPFRQRRATRRMVDEVGVAGDVRRGRQEAEVKASAAGAPIEFTVTPELLLDSRYDLKRLPFRTPGHRLAVRAAFSRSVAASAEKIAGSGTSTSG